MKNQSVLRRLIILIGLLALLDTNMGLFYQNHNQPIMAPEKGGIHV